MAKLKLGSAPKNFKRTIQIPLVDGTTADLEMVFKYKTRTEYGDLMDSLAKIESEDEVKTVKDAYKRGNDADAGFILKIAEGWDLDDAFTKANVAKMVEEFPAAAAVIFDEYKNAIVGNRVKN